MSFGFGVGDIVTISALAWKVFKSCKDASEDFKNLSGEVVSLHVVLKETEDLVSEHEMNRDQATQLKHLAAGCQKVLEDLEQLLTKYQSLGSKSQRTWDRLKWGKEGIADVRARLTSTTSMLSTYSSVMMNSSITRIEHKLNQFMEEIRSGKRESSVTSNSPSLLEHEIEDEAGWAQLRKELEDAGVSPAILSQHKQFVITWFQQNLAQDVDRGSSITSKSVDSEGSTQISDIASDASRSVDTDAPKPSPPDPKLPDVSPRSDKQSTELTTLRPKLPENSPINGRSMVDASRMGDVDSVDRLLRCNVDINYKNRADHMCALNTAAMYGHSDVVRLLIERPDININNKNWLGHTPLSLAAWYGHLDVVQVLLTKPETEIDPEDREVGQTPLSLATEQGNTSIVQLLLANGADPNSRDSNGRTPLGWAAEKGRPEETKLLLASSRIIPNLADRHGITPLHQAVRSRHDHIVRLLLSRKDVDLNSRDSSGRTALDHVVRSGHFDLVFYFEQAGAPKLQ